MKVILRKDIDKLGRMGDIKEVKPGHARNYLLPNRLVELATPGVIKNWQLGADRRKAKFDKETDQAKVVAAKLAGMTLSFSRAAGENEQLFGSVGKSDIIKSLKASGLDIPKEAVQLPAPIKTAGDSEVTLNLKPGVSAKIKIRVSPKTA